MVDAGEFPERVRLERYDEVADDWAPFTENPEVWAGIEALGEEAYRVRIRYRPDLVGLKDAAPTVRVIWPATPSRPSDRVLDVTDITEVDRRQRLYLICRGRLIESENLGSGAHRRTPWPR